ncbi:MAG: hypothetical protein JNL08_04550 [Planctomycetes bacterium]|nr:hypothetical protein [Planctomycetota bacterium]
MNLHDRRSLLRTRSFFRTSCASFLLLLGAACSGSRGFIRGGESEGFVQLSGNNYQAVQMGAVGVSTGFALFGFIPLWSPTYSQAKQDLLRNLGTDLRGRAPILMNQMEDSGNPWFLLFSLPRLMLTADVYEFTGPPAERTPAK